MEKALQIRVPMSEARSRHITEVINTYSKRLMGFIRRRVNNEADAEDILQDVFYQFMGNTKPIEQLTSWLFTVTRNKITDRQRKKKPELLDDLYGDGRNRISTGKISSTTIPITPKPCTCATCSGKLCKKR